MSFIGFWPVILLPTLCFISSPSSCSISFGHLALCLFPPAFPPPPTVGLPFNVPRLPTTPAAAEARSWPSALAVNFASSFLGMAAAAEALKLLLTRDFKTSAIAAKEAALRARVGRKLAANALKRQQQLRKEMTVCRRGGPGTIAPPSTRTKLLTLTGSPACRRRPPRTATSLAGVGPRTRSNGNC
eukprot:GHVT01075702.1.p1 GENE.GHVT01075702.1~~GHVT01075702.1.p1  ORF type:complete len:186 (-),score=46.15 GHVT01075702.1:739-1296(-)